MGDLPLRQPAESTSGVTGIHRMNTSTPNGTGKPAVVGIQLSF